MAIVVDRSSILGGHVVDTNLKGVYEPTFTITKKTNFYQSINVMTSYPLGTAYEMYMHMCSRVLRVFGASAKDIV